MLSLTRKAETLIQKYVFYNPWLKPLVRYKYYRPDSRMPEVPISDRAKHYLNELRENGVTSIPGFDAVAHHIDNTYIAFMEGRVESVTQQFRKFSLGNRDDVTNTENYQVSFKDPGLTPVLLDPDVCGILYNYYRRQPLYREQPWVIRNALASDIPFEQFSKLEVSAKFHTDFYRQITLMLLVSDLTEADTHLEYAIGSHKYSNTWDRYAFEEESITRRFPIAHCVGKKGTLIIMDAGSGFHRGAHKPGSVRKTLQCVLTTGHYFPAPEQKMAVADWAELSTRPSHIRRMFDDLRTD